MGKCGGIERIISALLQGVSAEHFRQQLFLLRRLPREEELDFSEFQVFPPQVISSARKKRFGDAGSLMLKGIQRIVVALRLVFSSVDIVHIHRGDDRSHYLLAALCRIAGKKVIRTIHRDPMFPGKRSLFSAHRMFTGFPNAWIVLSPKYVETTANLYGVDRDRIRMIPNGVDIARFQQGKDKRLSVRIAEGLSNEFVVLSVGRLDTQQKDYDTLLRGFSQVALELPNAVLWIVGGGSGHAEIVQRVEALSLENKVRFFGARNDIPELMAAADVFAFSTHFEGLPLVPIEAMASELPVVATNVSSLSYVCDHGRAGLLFEHRDFKGLARALLRIAKDPALASELCRRAKERVEREFSINAMVSRYETLYLDVMHGRI
ncbi:MAG: glycosyltransferase family 4 protein [Gammaproteobacteria bacterium]|nr:glycosyltransferase family 4 protein [Gammaproteobacteria bacterium]